MKIGLALGAGGAKGLAHIEFLKAFDELKIKPCIIAGTSMGALIGAFYAAGYSGKDIEKIYREMNLRKMARLIDVNILAKHGIVKGHKLTEWFEKILPKNFRELEIPLKVIGVDFWQQKEIVIEKGKLIDAIRSSISIPGIFEPVKIGSSVVVDGGLINPVPFDKIQGLCDKTIAINVLGRHNIKNIYPDKPNILDQITGASEIMQNEIFKGKKGKPDIKIDLTISGVRTLEFHKYNLISEQVKPAAATLKRKLKKLI